VTVIHAALLSAVFLFSLLAVKAVEKDRLLELVEPILRIVRRRSK
jgi:hypothetical protein